MDFVFRSRERLCKCIAAVLCIAFITPFQAIANARLLAQMNAAPQQQVLDADSLPEIPRDIPSKLPGDRVHITLDESGEAVASDSISIADLSADTVMVSQADSIAEALLAERIRHVNDSIRQDSIDRVTYGKIREFNPDPTRAVWLSVLFPGLGQIYNRRYWKLPIIVGGYAGLAYATSWNNQMLQDYAQAYRDITDDDPNTNSYMDFYASTVTEADLDMEWLESTLQSKRNYYRRYRDLCIILMVGVYVICIIDAYVDASLANFNVSPNLSMNVKFRPTLLDNGPANRWPAIGGSLCFEF